MVRERPPCERILGEELPPTASRAIHTTFRYLAGIQFYGMTRATLVEPGEASKRTLN